jgi:hypothetical protein
MSFDVLRDYVGHVIVAVGSVETVLKDRVLGTYKVVTDLEGFEARKLKPAGSRPKREGDAG